MNPVFIMGGHSWPFAGKHRAKKYGRLRRLFLQRANARFGYAPCEPPRGKKRGKKARQKGTKGYCICRRILVY